MCESDDAVAYYGNDRHVVTRVVEGRKPLDFQDVHVTNCQTTGRQTRDFR